MSKRSHEDAVGAVAESALTLVTELAKPVMDVATGVGITAAIPLVGPVLTFMKNRKERAAKRCVDTFVKEYAKNEAMTAEEAAGRLASKLHEDDQRNHALHDAIWRAVRGLMDAVDDAVAVPLGILVAEYARAEQKPDVFFRSTVSLLQELEHREMLEIRRMLKWALDAPIDRTIVLVANYDHEHSRWTLRREQYEATDGTGMRGVHRDNCECPSMVAEPDKILNLMQKVGITAPCGSTPPPTTHTALVRDYAERLLRLLQHVEG